MTIRVRATSERLAIETLKATTRNDALVIAAANAATTLEVLAELHKTGKLDSWSFVEALIAAKAVRAALGA